MEKIIVISGEYGLIESIVLHEPKSPIEALNLLSNKEEQIEEKFRLASIVEPNQEYLVSSEFFVRADTKGEESYPQFTRQTFMDLFRNDNVLDTLTVDDRKEIFLQVLLGSSDITKELLQELFSDYQVSNLKIVDNE